MRIRATALIISLAVSFTGISSATAVQPAAPAKKFASCEALLKKYPKGIAETKDAATRATDEGFATPRVNKAVYKANSARLDRDKDGVMCEQSSPGSTEAQPVETAKIQHLPTGSILLDVWVEGHYTQKQGVYAFSMSRTIQDPKFTSTICRGWRADEAGIAETLVGISRDLMNEEVTETWVRQELPMIVTTTCVAKGYSFL